MRTLQLTHHQIELITQALGVAEGAYTDMHKDIIHKLVRIRGNNEVAEHEFNANFYHVKSCSFAALCNDIEASKFDV